MFDEKDQQHIGDQEPVQEQPSALDNLEAQTQPEAPIQVKPEVETEQKANFRRLKEERDKAQRERDEVMRLWQQQQMSQQVQQPSIQENFDMNVGDDELIEAKHVKKLQQRLNKLESDQRAYQAETTNRVEETRIKARFPDFDEVVSEENVAALREADPEIFKTLQSSGDIYSKGVSAYKIIKKMGLGETTPKYSYSDDRERLQANALKPKSPSAVGAKTSNSSLGHAGAFEKGITPELKKQYLAEMMQWRNKS